jgi:hypothetical protein
MLGATAIAAAAAWGVAGGGQPADLAVVVLLIASTATFLPVILGPVLGPARWGFGVLAASGVRTLLMLFGGLAVDAATSAPRQPMWLGILAGAGVILAAETAAAILMVHRMERARLARERADA